MVEREQKADLANQLGTQISVVSSDTLLISLQAAVDKLVTAKIVARAGDVYVFSSATQPDGIIIEKNQTVLELSGRNRQIGEYSVHRLDLFKRSRPKAR